MPKYEETVALLDMDKDSALAIAYETFTELGWATHFSEENSLIGFTNTAWKKVAEQVLVDYTTGNLHVTGSLINGELFDLLNKNKKNVTAFVQAFTTAKQNLTEENLEVKKTDLYSLKQQIKKDEIIARQETEEVDKVMKISGSNLYVTYGIILANIIVFILMAVDGAGIFEPNGLVHMKWGSNYSPLTLSGDWWRLLSSTFLHFGVIHLAMNMYCLYTIGVYLEPMLGKVNYTVAYLCTGILASLVSLWWHSTGANSAGASGAVFGLYGLFLALLTTDLIPKSVRSSLLQSIGIFIAFNLFYGLKGGVDNSAHVGGLVSGFIIGYLYVISIRKENKEQKAVWVLPLDLGVSLIIPFLYLNQNNIPASDRNQILSEIEESSFSDNDDFNVAYNQFVEKQTTALEVLEPSTNESVDKNEIIKKLTEISLPEWEKASLLANQMQRMNVSAGKRKKAEAVLTYIELRKEEVTAYIDALNNVEGATEKLSAVRKQIDNTVGKINE